MAPIETVSMMTIEEIGKSLKLYPLTVRRLATEGEIPAFKVGRQWRVKGEFLGQWLEEKSMQNVIPITG